MKKHTWNRPAVIFFLLLCNSSLIAQEFEGELNYTMRDAAGKNSIMKYFRSKGHERISGMIGLLPVDMYFTADSMAMVFPKKDAGIILSIDSAKVFFQSTITDSLIKISPTSRTKIISGYHCTCIDASFRSGKKSEYWFTTEVDSNLCKMFARSSVIGDMLTDGTTEFNNRLNREGKFIIHIHSVGEDGEAISESTLSKVIQRPVNADEIEIPLGTALTRINPEDLKRFNAKSMKKI